MEKSIDFKAEDKIFESDSNKKLELIQSIKVSLKKLEEELVSSDSLALSCECSKRTDASNNNLKSSNSSSSLLTVRSDSPLETEKNTIGSLLYTSSLSSTSANSGNALEKQTNQIEDDFNIYSLAVSILSVSNESLEQDTESHADHHSIKCDPPATTKVKSSFYNYSKSEFVNASQTQGSSHLVKNHFIASPVSSNSSGYCSTSQSSSFLEFDLSSFLSTSSSHSLSNSSDTESDTCEYTVQNPSDFDSKCFGKNKLENENFLQSQSSENLMYEPEKQISQLSSKINVSFKKESILSENIEMKSANQKLKDSRHLKSDTKECVYKRNNYKPKTFCNSTYKPETDVKLNKRNGEKSLFIYEENNRTSDSTKWETFFSSRPKSQFESCSSQRYKATNLLKKPKKYPILTKDSHVEYSVDRLLSFNEETFIDTHCHLDLMMDKIKYNGNFTDYRREFPFEFPPSYGGCVAIFCNPLSFNRNFQWKKLLSEKYIWAAFGCHPKSANHYSDSVEDDLCSALLHPQVRALGEIGLDYSERSVSTKPLQKQVFKRQIKIGLAFELPLVIHCRDAYDDCLEILKEFVPQNHPIHLHCFTSDWSVAQKYLKAFPNLCIGVTNVVTFKSSLKIQEVAKNIPLDRLLLETDAPYFIPNALSGKYMVSHPGMAIFVAAKVASLKNIPLKNILLQTRKNTKKVYKI